MLKLLWHVWHRGHSVYTNRDVQTAPMGGGRGWVMRCECGLVVAR